MDPKLKTKLIKGLIYNAVSLVLAAIPAFIANNALLVGIAPAINMVLVYIKDIVDVWRKNDSDFTY